MTDTTYLTLKQAAKSSGMAYAALRRQIESGRLAACRVGRKYFLSAAELEAFCSKQRQGVAEDGYTIRQIMEILPLSYAFVIELIKSGKLAAVKCGRRYIIPRQELERFLAQAQCNPKQKTPADGDAR